MYFFSSGLSLCVLCKTETDEQIVKLGEKGCQGLKEASIEKGILNTVVSRYENSELLRTSK